MEPEKNRQFVAKAARLSTPRGLLLVIVAEKSGSP